MEKENMFGLIKKSIRVNGTKIKCMEKVNTGGLTEDSMKESINKTRNMDKVNLFGKMEENMTANGNMENKVGKDTTLILKVLKDMVNGIKVKELIG